VLGPSPWEPNNDYPNAIMTNFAKNPTAHPVFVSHACSRIKKKTRTMLYVPLAATLRTTRNLNLASKTTLIVPLTATAPSCLK
jgi:hypothetical protein